MFLKKKSSRDPEDENPLSDEEIQAQYFPNPIPIASGRPSLDLGSLRFTGDEWEASTETMDVTLPGSPLKPDANAIGLLNEVILQWDNVKEHAVAIARTYTKDEGHWSLDAIHLGQLAARSRCDFLIEMRLSPTNGSNGYEYTSFLACFTVTPGESRFLVRRFIVEFQ